MKPTIKRHIYLVGFYVLLVIKFYGWNYDIGNALSSLKDPIFLVPFIIYWVGFILHDIIHSPFSKRIERVSLIITCITMTLFMILTPKLSSGWGYVIYGITLLGSLVLDYGFFRTLLANKNDTQ